MKKLFAAILAAFSLNASALPSEADLWVTLSTSDNGMVFSALRNSGHFDKNDRGVPVYVVDGRTVDSKGDIVPQQWYVTLEQCKVGRGFVTTLDSKGNYVAATKYALGMGTVASHIAQALCSTAEEVINDNNNKNTPPKKSKGTV